MLGIRHRRGRTFFAAACVAIGIAVPAAIADVGEVTPQACIQDDATGAPTCASVAPAMNGSRGVAEWNSAVYTVSSQDHALVRFDRNLDTGALGFRQCFENTDEDCGRAPVTGLRTPSSVLVPEDGHSLYVTSSADDAVVAFKRSLSGNLTEVGCVEDNEDSIGCGDSARALRGAAAIAATQRSVWVASSTDSAVQHFKRSRSRSTLTPMDCIRDETATTRCGDRSHGLTGARGIAVSPTGSTLYVASSDSDGALVTIPVDKRTGALSKGHCVASEGDDAETSGCLGTAPGLAGAAAVVVSPDGSSVYAIGSTDDALVQFNRSGDGRLTFHGCVENRTSSTSGDCVIATPGLDAPRGLAISPDGMSVYVATDGDDSLVHFRRDPATGELSPYGCVNRPAGADECAQTSEGLHDANRVTVSLDGRSVYVTSDEDDAVASFTREPATGRLSPAG